MSITRTDPAPFTGKKEFSDIPMTTVQSNQVKAIGYDAATKTLAVTFASGPGHIYHYPGVSAETHAAFLQAESIGKYFGQHIKPLKFKKFEAPEQERAQRGRAQAPRHS